VQSGSGEYVRKCLVASDTLEAIQDLISEQNWNCALPRLTSLLEAQPTFAHAWYLLGQCLRFSGKIASSISALTKATQLDPSQESYFLALGIAYQLNESYEESLGSLRQAHAIKSDYVEAYISAAITLKHMGNPEKSAEIFDEAANALILQHIRNQPNDYATRIYGFRPMQGGLWTGYLSKTMLLICAQQDIGAIRFPTSKTVALEYESHENGGLFWKDVTLGDGQMTRILMPNLYDYVRESLISDMRYSLILGDKSLVLSSLGRFYEAEEHKNEALAFQLAAS
jgi:tetratricopeptide (TPR) repeat protein